MLTTIPAHSLPGLILNTSSVRAALGEALDDDCNSPHNDYNPGDYHGDDY